MSTDIMVKMLSAEQNGNTGASKSNLQFADGSLTSGWTG
jgi:hypothetical protein